MDSSFLLRIFYTWFYEVKTQNKRKKWRYYYEHDYYC